MKMVQMMAISVAAIVCVAAVAYLVVIDEGSGDGKITIIDGAGATISLDEPIKDVVLVNTNVPKAMKVLGLTEEVKGLSFSTSSNDSNFEVQKEWFTNPKKLSSYPSLSAEEVAMVAKYIICPVASMTLSSIQEDAFKQIGITVIRLDCYGDSALKDLEKLTILFGQSEKIMDAYGNYLAMYNGVVNMVKMKVAAATGTANETFLYYMSSSHAFYNHTSEGSAMIESIYGHNALRDIPDISTIGVTNSAGQDGISEVVRELDSGEGTHINKIFIRGSTITSESASLTIWNNGSISLSSYGFNAAIANEVYVLNSNIMSGMLSFIGYVAIAEICGITTGFSIEGLIESYNQMYGFEEKSTGLIFQMTGSGTGFTEFTKA